MAVRASRSFRRLPQGVLDHALAVAFRLYRAGRLGEAGAVCESLLACDRRYWWPRTLYVSVLRRQGRWREALAAARDGLRLEPRQPELVRLHADLVAAAPARYTSRLRTLRALVSMNTRRGSTRSPISVENSRSAS